jgi:hypothetical protein
MNSWPDVDPGPWERFLLSAARAWSGLSPTSPLARQFKAADQERSTPAKWLEEFVQPRGVTVTPLKVMMVELFFEEDLAPLKAGLRSIHQAFGAGSSGRSPSEVLERLVAKGLPGGWASLFTFKLPGTGESVNVHVHTLTPTTGAVAFEASPSDGLVTAFRSIVSQPPPREDRYWRIRRRTDGPPGWYLDCPSPLAVRKRQIEREFLKVNAGVSELLGRHVGAGAFPRGPLPSLEAFLVETNDLSRPITDGDMDTFWQSIEMPQRPGALYRQESVTMYAPLWTSGENLYFRARASVDDAAMGHRESLEGTKEEAAAMRLTMTAGWYELQVLLAILHHLDGLHRKTARLADDFARGRIREHLDRLQRLSAEYSRAASSLFDPAGELLLGRAAGPSAAKATPREDWIHAATHLFRETGRQLEGLREIASLSK